MNELYINIPNLDEVFDIQAFCFLHKIKNANKMYIMRSSDNNAACYCLKCLHNAFCFTSFKK